MSLSPTAAPSGDDAPNDVDLALRHVTRQFPVELAHAILPDAKRIEVEGWHETQLTARQRRLDRALWVKVEGVRRLLHLEWQLVWLNDVLFRVFEYHAMQAIALGQEWREKKRETPVPRIDSRVILLSGRDEPWSDAEMVYPTAPDDGRFCGVQFRIEPVYQYTLGELLARDNLLWMIFAPLTRDATPDAMKAIIERLKQRVRSPQQFEELASAMTVMADADMRDRGLRGPITACLPRELVMRSWIYQEGNRAGEIKGSLGSLRVAVETTLKARGLRVTPRRHEQIAQESDPDVLLEWLRAAATAERLADVFGK
jgi:hypothetical protein